MDFFGIRHNSKKENAVQINEVSQSQSTWMPIPWIFPIDKKYKPIGTLYLETILNTLWKGLSNVSFDNISNENIVVSKIIDFVDSNIVLLTNMWINKGYICVFYNHNFTEFRIPQDNELKYDKYQRIINPHCVVEYSPQYQTNRTSLMNIARPIVLDINKMGGSEDFLTENFGFFLISGQDVPLSPQGKKQLIESMEKNYGTAQDKYSYMLTNHDMKVQQVNPDFEKLSFRDKMESSAKILSNLFGVPLPLLWADYSTFNNIVEAKRFFYDTTIRYYAEIMLKIARTLLTESLEFLPQSTITYHISNVPELEKTLSAACEERSAWLDYLMKLKEAGIDVSKEINDLYKESKDLIKRV